MADYFDFQQSNEAYLVLADDAYIKRDFERAILFLKKVLETDPKNMDANLKLAKIYEGLDASDIALKIYLKAFTEDNQLLMLKISQCLIAEGKYDAAAHYMDMFNNCQMAGQDFFEQGYELDEEDIEGFSDLAFSEEDDFEDDDTFDAGGGPGASFRLVREKHGKVRPDTAELLMNANMLLRKGKTKDAAEAIKKIPDDSPYRAMADSIVLAAYACTNDFDRVVMEGEEILKKRKDNAIAAAVVGAYLCQEDRKNGERYIRMLMDEDAANYRFVKNLLALYANLAKPHENITFFEYILEKCPIRLAPMMFLAQSLYNAGRKDEALSHMKKVQSVYGRYSEAEYYIDFFLENDDKIDCSLGVPLFEVAARERAVNKLYKSLKKTDSKDLARQLKYDAQLKNLLNWAVRYEKFSTAANALRTLQAIRSEAAKEIVSEMLKEGGVPVENTAEGTVIYVETWGRMFQPVVSDCRWQNTVIIYPEALTELPDEFAEAYAILVAERVLEHKSVNDFAERLSSVIKSFAEMDRGRLVFKKGTNEAKIWRLHSERTLCALFKYKMKEGDAAELAKEYGTTVLTLKKYHEIIFGEPLV